MIPTICLSMITRNESKTIEKILDNIFPIIDTFCITDIGSLDCTMTIVTNYFSQRNMKGKIREVPYIDDISFNKNMNYEEARKMADYVFFLDSKTIVKINPGFKKKDLIHDKYLVKWLENNIIIGYKCGIIKSSNDAIYSNIITNDWITSSTIDEIRTEYIVMSNINIDDNESLKLLQKALEREPNNETLQLQLADIYYKLHDYNNAKIAYEKRIKMIGTDEEKWLCHYMIGIGYFEQNIPEKAILRMMEAYNCYPKRCENIYEVVKYYRGIGKFKLCEIFYNLGKLIKFPQKDVLGVNRDIYSFMLDYEYTIFNFYLDTQKSYQFKLKMSKFIAQLLNDCTNIAYTTSILYNLLYVLPILSKISEKIVIVDKNIETSDTKKLYGSTPSFLHFITDNDDCYYLNQKYGGDSSDKEIVNVLSKYDKNLILINDIIIKPTKINDENYNLNNVNLCQIGEKLCIVANSFNVLSKCYEIVIGFFDTESKTYVYDVVTHQNSRSIEKNWVMFKNNDNEMRIIYKWNPLEIGYVKGSMFVTEKIVETPAFFKNSSGSSNGYIDPLNNRNVWFIVHFKNTAAIGTVTKYIHYFVILDRISYEIVKYSAPFKFSDKFTEYCLGLIIENDEIIISFSADINTNYVSVYNRQTISELFV